MDSWIPILVIGTLLFGMAAYFYLQRFRHGSFKGALFGARIDRTVGEVDGESRGPVSVGLKVHVLRREPAEKLVGVELVSKSFASYQMMPITLSDSEARRLVSMLDEAIG